MRLAFKKLEKMKYLKGSKKIQRKSGYAVTVDMYMKETKLLMYVQYVLIHKVIWKYKQIIINNNQNIPLGIFF